MLKGEFVSEGQENGNFYNMSEICFSITHKISINSFTFVHIFTFSYLLFFGLFATIGKGVLPRFLG
ncbi:hypothetical protein C4A76_15730 [Brevibacillus laterosporus]|uniref:Uncharacterized protein n=1 Tax=Brevibacillus laterosporus TaxID=1465 RepID=A0AAP8QGI7_BRELA|nr:hypothetical protein C4A76_15730 [Brevibacillus laterosporus]PPB10623.1 hypothetical protein C4A77_05495 [Brevibacillus laterosporus]